MENVEKAQKQLLELAQYIYYETPISADTQKAFLETPRHRFVKRYREWASREWHEVNQQNLQEHLAVLYADRAICLFGDDDENIASTISQPTFVLRMLDMLRIEPGHKVFELGAGSGWNAALLGNLVGPQGSVHSLELIPEMARTAAASIAEFGIANVKVIEGDGGEGYAEGAPYDRAIFTAGAYDLPRHFFEQVRQGGLLLAVIKSEGGGDSLFLLQKVDGHFESIDSLPCAFVQMKGRHKLESLEPLELESLPEWSELKRKPAGTRPYWWGGKGKDGFGWRTLGIRSFLGISEPRFRAFKTKGGDQRTRDEHFFGLWDQAKKSLVLAKDDLLVSYGSPAAEQRLLKDLEGWVGLGMPGAASFALQIHPLEAALTAGENRWIIKRREAQFVWSLKTRAG